MIKDSTPVEHVSKEKMQELFNTSNLLERKEKGEIREVVDRERHADPFKSGQIFCTFSQIVSWFERDTQYERARFHRYLKPDGKIGASGREDPVRLFLDKTYKLKPKP